MRPGNQMKILFLLIFIPGIVCAQVKNPEKPSGGLEAVKTTSERIAVIMKNPLTKKMTKKSFGTKNPTLLIKDILKAVKK
jgi:hypothetical protein